MGVLCGVDIVEIDRVRKSFEISDTGFRNRVFTQREIEYCENRNAVKYMSYAARFAAKEAVSKALGTGIGSGIKWKDVEVLNDNMGKPFVVLTGKAKELYEELSASDISLSLSHCNAYAVAYAVIEVGR